MVLPIYVAARPLLGRIRRGRCCHLAVELVPVADTRWPSAPFSWMGRVQSAVPTSGFMVRPRTRGVQPRCTFHTALDQGYLRTSPMSSQIPT